MIAFLLTKVNYLNLHHSYFYGIYYKAKERAKARIFKKISSNPKITMNIKELIDRVQKDLRYV
jgi:hypothetical protein